MKLPSNLGSCLFKSGVLLFRLNECLPLHSLQKRYPNSSAWWFCFLSFRKLTNVWEATTRKKLLDWKISSSKTSKKEAFKITCHLPKCLQQRRHFQIQLVNSNLAVLNSLQSMSPLGMGLQNTVGNMDLFTRLDKTNCFFSLTKQGWEGQGLYKYI